MKEKKNTVKIICCVLVGFAVFSLTSLMLAGYRFSWGPFSALGDYYWIKFEGNNEKYAPENCEIMENSPLQGMNIAFLGSSVTFGASSVRDSFADYIAARNGADFVKDAVSGTTLVDEGASSYIARLKRMDKSADFDLFIVQLSTNDASQKKPLGEIVGEGGEYDTHTVCGAMEFIREYVEKTWGVPVVFYTGSYYESEEYAKMVEALLTMKRTYGESRVGVIDLYTDKEFNDVTDEEYALYMADPIHPMRAGYLLWWTPKMEAYLYDFVAEDKK